MSVPAVPQVTAVRLGADPLAAAGDPALTGVREELGVALEAAVPMSVPAGVAGLPADTDIIVRHADSAAFDTAGPDGQAALGALARVTALLARQPGGIDFAGRHWCTGQPCGRHPGTAARDKAPRPCGPASRYLRKKTGSYYTPPELIHQLASTTLVPLVFEALTADGGTRGRPLIGAGGTYYTTPQAVPAGPEQALRNLTVCDPACGAGAFLVAAARLIAWYAAMYRAGRDGSIDAELPPARRDVITSLIHGVDISPLAVDVTRLALAAEALVPGLPNPYLAHHVKCGNALIGATPALLARGIPDGAYKPLEGGDPRLAAAARNRNRAEREAWLNGLPEAPAPPVPQPLAAMARAHTWTSPEQAHRELEASPEVRLAKRVADAWCAAFAWPHRPGGPDPVTTGTLLHLAAGGQLPPEAEDTLAALAREHQFFHWHLEFPGIFRRPWPGEPGETAATAAAA
jgi:hypothetical protein